MSVQDIPGRFGRWAVELAKAYGKLVMGKPPYGPEEPDHEAEPSDDPGSCVVCRQPIYSLIRANAPRAWHHQDQA